jgi:hypothetical protein
MRATVGDQLVGPGVRPGFGELIGVVTEVQGRDGEPPYMIRWYSDDHEALFSPDAEHYWIRSHEIPHEMRVTSGALHRFGSARR